MPPKRRRKMQVDAASDFVTKFCEEGSKLNEEAEQYLSQRDCPYLTVDNPYLMDVYTNLKKHFTNELLSKNVEQFLNVDEFNPKLMTPKENVRRKVKEEVFSPMEVDQPAAAFNHPPTVLRAPIERDARTLTVATPLGNRNVRVPKMLSNIAPRLKNTENVVAGRVIGADEITFSINGSPVVGPAGITAVLDEVLSKPEEEMTPTSKQLATTLKAVLLKKLNE
ncbi:unnamed protein product, partial [Mesorhabditis belari]|uniref:Borealin n=1 Tax=Mesorhabditis belari TaxID=2138241 RepID=A0AAF3EAQ2_9BILA